MRKIMLALGVSALALSMLPAGAFHSGACGTAGTTLLQSPGTAGVLGNDEVVNFRVVVPSGQQGFLHMQALNGDVDVETCRVGGPGNGTHQCSGHNAFPFGDGCHFPELETPCPICVGGSATYGLALTPGTHRVMVHRCFQDTDGCDYSFGFAPGEVWDVYPVAYTLAFQLN